MHVNAALLLEVWEAISESLPNNKREDMARKLVHVFADKGMERNEFESILGEDDHLDNAIDAQYTGDAVDPYDYDEYELEESDD